MRRHLSCAILACVLALMAGCAPVKPIPALTAGATLPPEFPEAYYRHAIAQGKPVYRIDPAGSLVVIEVRRSGSLARLGHDHVVASHDVGGYVVPADGRADLYVPLVKLAVDEAALRIEAGFDTQPSESDIAGTRSNMLNSVLEVDRFPFALMQVTGADAGQANATIKVALTLHGTTRTPEVAAQVESGGGQLVVSGRLSIDQTDFGITPYAVLGGAIAVRNGVDMRFRIRAVRLDSQD
ncbi:MAG TPA: YceI family protein [Burkholderiaceae bacterium]|nr:YceI family protein [Burkholderiaceae bacterium]